MASGNQYIRGADGRQVRDAQGRHIVAPPGVQCSCECVTQPCGCRAQRPVVACPSGDETCCDCPEEFTFEASGTIGFDHIYYGFSQQDGQPRINFPGLIETWRIEYHIMVRQSCTGGVTTRDYTGSTWRFTQRVLVDFTNGVPRYQDGLELRTGEGAALELLLAGQCGITDIRARMGSRAITGSGDDERTNHYIENHPCSGTLEFSEARPGPGTWSLVLLWDGANGCLGGRWQDSVVERADATVSNPGGSLDSHRIMTDFANGSWSRTAGVCSPRPCDSLPGPPSGACCPQIFVPTGTLPQPTCIIATASGCARRGWAYAGDGTNCAAAACPGLGACCDPLTGHCDERTQLLCAHLGGLWHGVGSRCDGVSCPAPARGACCVGSLCFGGLTLEECKAAGGAFRGADSTCINANCQGGGGTPTERGCCLPDGRCVDVSLAECLRLKGFPYRSSRCGSRQCIPNPVPAPAVPALMIRGSGLVVPSGRVVLAGCSDCGADTGF